MANTIELVTKFAPYTDELFATESRKSLLTNQDFDWSGAHSVKIYRVTTSKKKDRSFTFAIDALDEDETAQQLAAASALARQLRQVVVPEVDSYTYNVMCTNAGHKPAAKALDASTIYTEILTASEALDSSEVPETGRILVLTPSTYTLLKKSPDVVMETDVGAEMRLKGAIGMLDGMSVLKVPANRLPPNFGFLVAHPIATVAPTKLESYVTHFNPPGINGSLVEGRIVYDAFVLENKAEAIFYQSIKSAITGS